MSRSFGVARVRSVKLRQTRSPGLIHSRRGRLQAEDQEILRADMNGERGAHAADFERVLFSGLDEDVWPERKLVLLDFTQIADVADGCVKTVCVGDTYLHRLGAEAKQDFLAS